MIVSFEDYVPPPRFDAKTWRQIRIEEGATADGPWVVLETQGIVPLDVDPTSPAARDFTTELATMANGWYRISFIDQDGNILLTDPVQNIAPYDYAYKPTISLVARKVMSRTRDAYGKLLATFTPDTLPTDTEVVQIVDDVTPEVADAIGDVVPEPLTDDAANVVALRAAMQIETDFFADQVNTGRSIYPQLKEQYDAALANLQRQIVLFGEGETTVTGEGGRTGVSYNFPDDSGWLTRRM